MLCRNCRAALCLPDQAYCRRCIHWRVERTPSATVRLEAEHLARVEAKRRAVLTFAPAPAPTLREVTIGGQQYEVVWDGTR